MRPYERTPEQIEASRTNGSSSQGPVTDEGKASSSQNARTHGLLADVVVLPSECREAFDSLLNDSLNEFDPQTRSELQMVHEMVVCQWRQLRTWTMVHQKHANEIEIQPEAAQPRSDAVLAYDAMDKLNRDGATPRLMERYDGRFSRTYRLLRRELQAMKKERKKAEYN